MSAIRTATFTELDSDLALKSTFFPYSVTSISLLFSTSTHHYNPLTPPRYSKGLREDALGLINKGFRQCDMGRLIRLRKDPVKVINDVDLYLCNGKIHVATERGLLIAVDYLRLLCVPDTQPVRFEGETPSWAKSFLMRGNINNNNHNLRRGVGAESEGISDLSAKRPSPSLKVTKLVAATTIVATTNSETTGKPPAAVTIKSVIPTGLLTPPLEKRTEWPPKPVNIDWPPEDEVDWSDSELD